MGIRMALILACLTAATADSANRALLHVNGTFVAEGAQNGPEWVFDGPTATAKKPDTEPTGLNREEHRRPFGFRPTLSNTKELTVRNTPCGAPLSLWSADNTLDDSVSGRHGTALGSGVSFTSGMVGEAFALDGGGWVEATDTGLPVGNDPRSLGMWIRTTTGGRVPAMYGNLSPDSAFYVYIHLDGRPCIGRWGGGDACASDISVTDGQWYYLLLSHDGSTTSLRVNDEEVASQGRTYSTSLTGVFRIGYCGPGCEFVGDIDHVAIVSGDCWTQVVGALASTGSGFGNSDNTRASGIEEFGGQLYVGTHNGATGAELWRTSDGSTYNSTMVGGFGDSETTSIDALEVFNGYLYAGTWDSASGCGVWRSTNGVAWSQSNADGFDAAPGSGRNTGILDMTTYAGRIYASAHHATVAPAEIWSSANGSTWSRSGSPGFGNPDNQWFDDLLEFDGYLYASVSNFATGCEVHRTADGSTWVPVVTNGFGDSANTLASGLAVLGNYLYVIAYDEVWRSSNGTEWTQVVDDGFVGTDNSFFTAIASHQGSLRVGTRNSAFGLQVWGTDDGVIWSQSSGGGFSVGTSSYVTRTANFRSGLYVLTKDTGNTFGMWRLLGPRIFVDGFEAGGTSSWSSTIQ